MAGETPNIFAGRLDRLSSLIERFRVHATIVCPDELAEAQSNFSVFRMSSGALRLVFSPRRPSEDWSRGGAETGEKPVVTARIEISGAGERLILALPNSISVDLAEVPDLRNVVEPLVDEITQPRCGGQAVFHRLCEIVVIRLLRHSIEHGGADVGLLAGLSHPRLARALVGVHEKPGNTWNLEALAGEAGMSRTQFAVTFKEVLGLTPGAYLSNWRLELARTELEAGTQVKTVARMCGFSSAAAFSRAFAKQYGYAPKLERKRLA